MDDKDYLIAQSASIFECLEQLNRLRTDLNLFVIDDQQKLLGSVTDGDIRRGILGGVDLKDDVTKVMNASCKFLSKTALDLVLIASHRKRGIKILPVVDEQGRITDLINFSKVRTLLPVDAVIMAGGTGSRLLPLTKKTPKPLLSVGEKPVLAHTLDRLKTFGISNINITINYLGDQIVDFIRNYDPSIRCVGEPEPYGTAGSVSMVEQWSNDSILLQNSDIITNLDYEDFFLEFVRTKADMMVAALPYPLKVPYAILETRGNNVTAFKEKPEYTYFANTGIYLFKKELVALIPRNTYFDATDLMSKLIEAKKKLVYYPMTGYWLDIGNHDDFKKAQEDIKHLNF